MFINSINDSLCQASLSRATKQLIPTPRGRLPPPTQWGRGSGLSHHVFRGAVTGRYLASWGGETETEETRHSESGEGGGGGGPQEEEEKRREEKRLSGGGCGG